jgi:ribA/ribD-fused uncharacterized protein
MNTINDENIISFTKVDRPYGWLGNMFFSKIEYDGVTWRTAEALFQSMRFNDQALIALCLQAASPYGLKLKLKQHQHEMITAPKSPEDVENMRRVLRLKFSQHPERSLQLIATGESILIEDVSARKSGNSKFWGAYLENGYWIGENMLGKLLMELREKLTNSEG